MNFLNNDCEFVLYYIDPNIDERHLDSFWYDGVVLKFTYRGNAYVISAEGEIRVVDKNGELVWDTKSRGDGITLKEDKDLKQIDDERYSWGNNNWFELTKLGEEREFPVVFHTLNELTDAMREIEPDFGVKIEEAKEEDNTNAIILN